MAAEDVPHDRSVHRDGSTPTTTVPRAPLMRSVRSGPLETIRILVRTGFDPDLSHDFAGWTSSPKATHEGQLFLSSDSDLDDIRWPLTSDADPTTVSEAGGIPRSLAVLSAGSIDRFSPGSCQTEAVRSLVEQFPGQRSPDNRTIRWALGTAHFFNMGCSETVDLGNGSSDHARSRTTVDDFHSPPPR